MNKDTVLGKAKQAGSRFQSVAGDAAGSDQHSLGGRILRLEGLLQSLLSQVKDGTFEAGHDLGELASGLYDHGRDYARRGGQLVRREVTEHPVRTALLGAAIGAGIYALLRQRDR